MCFIIYCMNDCLQMISTPSRPLFICFTCLPLSCILQICTKLDAEISTDKIRSWLKQQPHSPWWITNDRVADFCKIADDKNDHKSSILGKNLPRKRVFFQLCKGLHGFHLGWGVGLGILLGWGWFLAFCWVWVWFLTFCWVWVWVLAFCWVWVWL